MGENLPTEDEKLRAYSSITCNLRNIHHAMFPPSFGEKNEKLNSNLSFGGGVQRKKKTLDPNGNSKGENPLTSQKEKRKYMPKKTSKKKIAPKKQGKTHLTSKNKNREGQLPRGRSYNVAPKTFLRHHNHCSPTQPLLLNCFFAQVV
jgi:hypothetical protein